MRISKDTLKALSEGGCDKARDALHEYELMSIFENNDMALECVYNAHSDTFEVNHTWEKRPNHKRTLMGMAAVRV